LKKKRNIEYHYEFIKILGEINNRFVLSLFSLSLSLSLSLSSLFRCCKKPDNQHLTTHTSWRAKNCDSRAYCASYVIPRVACPLRRDSHTVRMMIEKGRTGTWYWLYEKVVRPRSYGSRKRESRV